MRSQVVRLQSLIASVAGSSGTARLATVNTFWACAAASAHLRHRSCCAQEELATIPAAPGTVPEYYHHLLIRGGGEEASSSCPWPPIVENQPPFVDVFRHLAQLRLAHPDIGAVKVTAFQEAVSSSSSSSSTQEDSGVEDAAAAAAEEVQQGRNPAPGMCDVLVYPEGIRYRDLPVAELPLLLHLHVSGEPPPGGENVLRRLLNRQEEMEGVQLFVCCHGTRDARCGSLGPPLVEALKRAASRLRIAQSIRVYPVSHVGGHKYAGNVLVYGGITPCDGDWFGGVTAHTADSFLRSLAYTEVGSNGGPQDPSLRPYWRGRAGMAKEEQLRLFEGGGVLLEDDEDHEDDDELWDEGEEKEEEEEGGGPPHMHRPRV